MVVFWLASIYCMLQILELKELGSLHGRFFIFLGITIGLCIMSKVHGLFLWFGFGAYIFFHRRHVLRNPYLWLSVLITLAIISPIYFWNVSIICPLHLSSGRLIFFQSLTDLSVFSTGIRIRVLFPGEFYHVCQDGHRWQVRISIRFRLSILFFSALPLIRFLIWTSLFSETLPHGRVRRSCLDDSGGLLAG
jgi:4-amino-4-deoxy-L-arabinose transferase-like glycosyltransferase